jgi:histidyl-tRNA synthetase
MLAKGTRDFGPKEKILRDYIVNTLKEVCENYGFNPIETPIVERYETLAAKFAAGEESDALKEIFKFKDQGNRKIGLRFDLTVPFARYIAMKKTIKMPFKKYMYGEVFRDGPLKTGRYREFTQLDPDVVGTKSMLADAEIISLLDTAFNKLGLKFYIELNNRKILDGVLLDAGIKEKDWFDITISIDKLKKIGKEGVIKELVEKGYEKKVVKEILDSLSMEKTNDKTLAKLKIKCEIGQEGLKEMKELFEFLKILKLKTVVFDPSLARGLAYYTGPIYEVFLKDSQIISSVAGGGRYDKLIGNYLNSTEEYPATGVSFGIDVIFEAMKKAGQKSVVQVYVIPIKTTKECTKIAKELRSKGVNTDMDLIGRGISKNLQYVDSYGIPYAIIVGQKELKQGKVKLRDMKTGKEEFLVVSKIVKKFTKI